MAKISVIITFNKINDNLNECLKSIINQKLDDLEIICVENQSGVNSDIFKEFKTDSRIKLLTSDYKSKGALKNLALSEVTGEYVYFMNPDAKLETNALNEIYEKLEENSSDILIFKSHGKHYTDYLNLIHLKQFKEKEIFNHEDLGEDLFDLPSCLNEKVFKLDLIKDMKFDENIAFEDDPFFIEAMLKAEQVSFYDKNLIFDLSDDTLTISDESLFDILPVSNSIIEITKKYNKFNQFKDKLINNKILSIYKCFISIEEKYKKEFFENIKKDLTLYENDIDDEIQFSNQIKLFYEIMVKSDNYESFCFYLELSKAKNQMMHCNEKIRYLQRNESARFDLKVVGDENNEIYLIEISDNDSKHFSPSWFNNNEGKGLIIESLKGNVDFKIKSNNDGDFKLWLRSIDIRNDKGIRLKTLMNYTSLKINGNECLNDNVFCWHDDPFLFEMKVTSSQIIDIHIEWETTGETYPKRDIKMNYPKIRQNLLNLDFKNVNFKKIPFELYSFYIRVLNFEEYDDFEKFNEHLRKDYEFIDKKQVQTEIDKFNELGITTEKRDESIIVSLTSFPERMNEIHYCLYSLLNQNLKPDEVVLWLAHEQFPNKEKDIPESVLKLKDNGLTIKWCNDLKSYKKLIPSLKEYPNDYIVTADDDIFYHQDWLESIWKTHLKYPDAIISSRSRKIACDENNIYEYGKWHLSKSQQEPSYLNFPTGAGGVLYVPNAFNKEIFNEKLFLELCPSTDDIWFWSMAVLNKTKIAVVEKPILYLCYVNVAREIGILDSFTLWNYNKFGQNDIQFNKILKKFPQIKDIINDD